MIDYTGLGVWALLAVILLREVVPLFIKTFFPAFSQERDRRFQEEQRISQQKAEEEKVVRDQRRRMEERYLAAFEKVADATDTSRHLLETISARLASIERDSEFTKTGIAILLDRIAADWPYRGDPKSPPGSQEKTLPIGGKSVQKSPPDTPVGPDPIIRGDAG